MKKAKRWIVSAGACLLALTGMSVSFGQIPTAPIPEQNNDGLPLLTEPAPIDVEPLEPMQAPVAPADVPAPAINAVPQTIAPAPAPAPKAEAFPEAASTTPAAQTAPTQQPCQQCCAPCRTCPAGALFTPTPYSGQETRPWWLNIRPVPYTPVERDYGGMGFGGLGLGGHGVVGHGFGGRFVRDRYGRLVPVEPPFYTTRGPRDFYLDNPRPLGY